MPRFRPRLEGLRSCAHGGPDYGELAGLGLRPSELLDFSVNCNPFGPPLGVEMAADRACWDRLPDSRATALREALGETLSVPPASIVVGNGSVELIRFLALACFGPGDTVVVPQPTFGEYETSLSIAGAATLQLGRCESDGFALDLGALELILRTGNGVKRPKGLFLCNPNNPCGSYLSRPEVERLLDALSDGLLILDEAYVPFVEGAWQSLDLLERGNLVILRSMTKDFALGGLRLGYAVGPEPIMDVLRSVLPPWNVNSVAQEAGLLALQDSEYPSRCLRSIIDSRDYLGLELSALGLRVLSSRTNFFLVEVGNAAWFRRSLLGRGFLVRDCTSFGLPSYVRISARSRPDCRRLVEAMRDLVSAGTE